MPEENSTVLITGGAGFFGSLLKQHLLDKGYRCVSVDRVGDESRHERLTSVRGDICDRVLMEGLFGQHRFACVFHIAAILAHDKENKRILWASNVDATALLAELCECHGTPKIVFTSSNCLWAKNFGREVTEEDIPEPIEIYGRSKLEGEKILLAHKGKLTSAIIRCPTIIDAGRLGLLTILFDFIREGRKVWAVGGGTNRYQFIYAPDLIDACVKAMRHPETEVFNIGSDHVESLGDVYRYVIRTSGTKARVCSLPRQPTLWLMRLCYVLGLSPLGPYHYKMIAEDFIFDTRKIKAALGWKPTLTNGEMMWRAYEYYVKNLNAFSAQSSAHRKPASMGLIRLLKWLS